MRIKLGRTAGFWRFEATHCRRQADRTFGIRDEHPDTILNFFIYLNGEGRFLFIYILYLAARRAPHQLHTHSSNENFHPTWLFFIALHPRIFHLNPRVSHLQVEECKKHKFVVTLMIYFLDSSWKCIFFQASISKAFLQKKVTDTLHCFFNMRLESNEKKTFNTVHPDPIRVHPSDLQ